MKKRSILTSILILLVTFISVLSVGCTKRTGLLTEYDFLQYTRMEYRSTEKGDAMLKDEFRTALDKILKDNGKRIKDSGILKFTKSNEVTMNFYPNVETLNALFSSANLIQEEANKILQNDKNNAAGLNNYFLQDFTIAKFAKKFVELFDRYVPGLKWDVSDEEKAADKKAAYEKAAKNRAEALLTLEKTLGLKIEGKEYFLTNEFQTFIDNLKQNKISPIKLPRNFGITMKLKLKSKKEVIKGYFKDGSDQTIIKRIASLNGSYRDDNFLMFEEYDISKKDAKSREIFDNIIGNRLPNTYKEAEKDSIFKSINSIMYARIELFQLDLVGVRK